MRTHRRTTLVAPLVVVTLAAILSACGSSGSSHSASASSGSASASASAASASASTGSASGKPFKVAFIYAGDPSSGSWDHAHDLARQTVQQHFGGKVQTSYKASVPQNNQAAQVIDGLVQAGNKVIFATSFGYNKFMEQAAAKYPDVKFLQMEQEKLMGNLGAYDIAEEDGFYPAGMMLAAASKSGEIGFVGSFPVPAILRVVNALQLGAQQVNPNAHVRPVWTNSWYDPSKERQAAESLLSSGADTLTDDVGDPAVAQDAASHTVPYVGINVDTHTFAKQAYVTGVTFNYAPYYISQIQSAMNGAWKSRSAYLRMDDGGIVLARYGPSYQDVKPADRKRINAVIAKIKGGWQPFTGPIKDQAGQIKVAANQAVPFGGLESMNWYVQGVSGAKNAS
jgi:basic membrane lipoprotein Med (substrate-binding protein (PBP1-ABC) superfamily)